MEKAILKSIVPVVTVIAFTAQAVDYVWNGSVDNNWKNAANWEEKSIPAVDENGAVFNSANTIRIQAGKHQPTKNVPSFAGGSNVTQTAPVFIIENGASLDINAFSSDPFIGAQNITGVTVESGGSLAWSASSSITFGRNSGVQTYNIRGTFTLTAPRINFGYAAGRLSQINLDGGTLELNTVNIYASRSGYTNEQAAINKVILTNGAKFITTGIFRVIGENELILGNKAHQALVFDIQDAASSVTFKLSGNSVRDFCHISAVEGALSKFFISSTLGNEALVVTENRTDRTVTITASGAK
ncbi:MAG: hypothetical protein WC959_03960 [Kiritimatiellales bacterium]